MNAGKRHEEIERLNQKPLNQVSKDLLRKAGQVPSPNTLLVYQMILWSLDDPQNVLTDPEDLFEKDILEEACLRLMFRGNPQKAYDLLMKPPKGEYGEPWVDPDQLKEMRSPREAGRYLATQLNWALRYLDPGPLRADDGEDLDLTLPFR